MLDGGGDGEGLVVEGESVGDEELGEGGEYGVVDEGLDVYVEGLEIVLSFCKEDGRLICKRRCWYGGSIRRR